MKMPDEKGLWSTLVSLIPEDMRLVVGIPLAVALLSVACYATIFVPMAIFQWATAKPASECWDLKEVAGRIVKFNKCTGDARAVDLPPKTEPALVK